MEIARIKQTSYDNFNNSNNNIVLLLIYYLDLKSNCTVRTSISTIFEILHRKKTHIVSELVGHTKLTEIWQCETLSLHEHEE